MNSQSSPKKRLDQWLVDLGLAPSKTKAKELVETGYVEVENHGQTKIVSTPGAKFDESVTIKMRSSELLKYVSRAGLKMEKALKHLNFDVRGFRVLDMGISTGGFSDCLLKSGVHFVVGVDVGHNQVAESLKSHSDLTVFEGLNGKEVLSHPFFTGPEFKKFDFAVMDVSFISMTPLVEVLASLVKPGGHILSLVKPQFELNSSSLNKKGIVKDAKMYKDVEEKVRRYCESHNVRVLDYFESGFPGRDGNLEFFVYGEVQ